MSVEPALPQQKLLWAVRPLEGTRINVGPHASMFALRHATTLIACYQQLGNISDTTAYVLVEKTGCASGRRRLLSKKLCERPGICNSFEPKASGLAHVRG